MPNSNGSSLPSSVAAVSSGRGKYYLTNQDLLPAVIEAKEKGKLTDKLAKMLMLLTDRYSRKSNFIGYSFREDMVCSALVNLCQNALKFDPARSNNPFAFYTTAIHNSFLQYMSDEKKHRYIRDTLLVDAGEDPSHGYTGYLNERDRPSEDSDCSDIGSDYTSGATSIDSSADDQDEKPDREVKEQTVAEESIHQEIVNDIKSGAVNKEDLDDPKPKKSKRQSNSSLVKF